MNKNFLIALVWRRALLVSWLVTALLIGPPFFTSSAKVLPGQAGAVRRELYMLSGTSTEQSDETYPVSLYRIGEAKKLKLVREVVAKNYGLQFVQAWDSTVFVAYPHILPKSVDVVHVEDPTRDDRIDFNPSGFFAADAQVGIAEQTPLSEELLLPLVTSISDPKNVRGTLATVAANPSSAQERLGSEEWGQYATLRLAGEVGGPMRFSAFLAASKTGKLVVSEFGHTVAVDNLPPSFIDTQASVAIVAASTDYLLFVVQRPVEHFSSGDGANSMQLYCHDRRHNAWKVVQVEGGMSRSRLFGPWLATIIEIWNPDHRPGPGRDAERSVATDRLPATRNEYAEFGGYWAWMPGILSLQNLEDGRKIRIETGQEDSEILWAGPDIVLYRVNDAIFQAKIVGDKLQDTTLVVRDEDVPEVHWVFWGP
jgi:hypothetical protein